MGNCPLVKRNMGNCPPVLVALSFTHEKPGAWPGCQEVEMVAHPGKTKAQRAALDAIGCGDPTPPMAPRTREALLGAGLIIECERKVVGRDHFGLITVPKYAMPIPVHMQWCDAVAGDFDEDDE